MTLPETIYTDLKAQLPALTEAIKQGAEWGTDLAHRFIVYDIWVHGIWIAFAILLLVIAAACVWRVIKHTDSNKEALQGLCVLAMIFLPIIALMILGANVPIIAKDLIVPEIRIAEILSELSNPTAK